MSFRFKFLCPIYWTVKRIINYNCPINYPPTTLTYIITTHFLILPFPHREYPPYCLAFLNLRCTQLVWLLLLDNTNYAIAPNLPTTCYSAKFASLTPLYRLKTHCPMPISLRFNRQKIKGRRSSVVLWVLELNYLLFRYSSSAFES